MVVYFLGDPSLCSPVLPVIATPRRLAVRPPVSTYVCYVQVLDSETF